MRDSDRKVLTIAAGKTSPAIVAAGTKIFVENASFPFILAIGGGNQNIVKAGSSIDTGDEPFTSIAIINPSTSAVLKVVIWIGTARVGFNYTAIPGTALVPYWGTFSGVSLVAPSTFVEGGLLTSTGVLFPGVATNAAKYSGKGIAEGNRRKQFVVTNRDPNEAIYISTGDLYVFAAVQPYDDYTLETDCDIRLHGKTSGNAYYIAEIFYL